jgi:hypothetical protein
MNERFKELAVQAKAYANQCTKDIDGDVSWHWMDYYTEKFAELIVAECLAHGKLTQLQPVINGSEEYNAGREMGIEVFMNQIEKHFGVEDRAIPILSADEQALFAGIASSKLFTIEGAKKQFGVEE